MLEKIKEYKLIILKGFLMGSADVVPGVSGGTMAFITGIYDRLLGALGNFDHRSLKLLLKFKILEFMRRVDLIFLLFLGMGILSALIFFTKVFSIPTLIRTHPEPIYGLFFGLIIATIILLISEFKKHTVSDFIFLVIGILFLLGIQYFIPKETPSEPIYMFFYGALAISAMVLPGISGSFILLMLGQYAFVLSAVSELNFTILIQIDF